MHERDILAIRSQLPAGEGNHLHRSGFPVGEVVGVGCQLFFRLSRTFAGPLPAISIKLLDNPAGTLTGPLDVYEGIYQMGECGLGSVLARLGANKYPGLEDDSHHQDLYYEIAAALLVAQGLLQKKIKKIAASSFVTQKELYRRVT